MTKTLLAALAAFPLVAGAAELAPGTLEVTGSTELDLSSTSTEWEYAGSSGSSDSTQAGVATAALYYVAPNLGLGLQGGYGYQRQEEGRERISSTQYSLGPTISYQVPVAPQLALFGRCALSVIRGSTSISGEFAGSSGTTTLDTTGWGLGLQAGVKYFPIRPVSLDAGVAWSRASLDQADAEGTVSSLGVNVGVSVYFGGAGQ